MDESLIKNLLSDYRSTFAILTVFGAGYLMIRVIVAGKRCVNKNRLDGKTVLITGANTGIGKETAKNLAKRGAKVIIACRNEQKGQQAVKEISEASRSLKVSMVKLDLTSLESVRRCAEKINQEETRLHILINNAGIMMHPKSKTEDGFEMHLGVNHLGPFLFTNLLLDLIEKSAPSRIVNVASVLHEKGKMDFDDLFFEKKPYSALEAYYQSKLANVLFTKELAYRLRDTSVTAYSLHPGVVDTDLFRHFYETYSFAKPLKFVEFIFKMFLKTPEQGAQTTLYCAVDEAVGSQTGLYYSDCAVKDPSPEAKKVKDAQRLWEVSSKLVGFKN